MGSFGNKLKREREMRGLTLDEISESTKIARRHLEALENEDFGSLPGGVFNKGFVRAYARFIGIDEDQAVADYVAAADEAPAPQDQFPLEIHEKPDRQLNPRSSSLPLIASVVALVLVVAGSVMWRAKHHSAEALAASSTSTQPEALQSKGDSADQTSAASSQSEADNPDSKGAAVERRVAATDSRAEKEKVSLEAKAPETGGKPAIPESSFVVLIKAKEDTWISVVADGRRVSHGILKADKQRIIRAGKQILLTTGNAGGIDISFNGKPLGAIGNESEARTLIFTPTGVTQQ
jgi:cytoskeleton protein RodZ